MKYPVIWFLKAYRLLISPLYGDVCRYYPSCSAYALEAVERHGALKGCWLAARRIGRCHPWAAGGIDPVPASYGWSLRARPAHGDQAIKQSIDLSTYSSTESVAPVATAVHGKEH